MMIPERYPDQIAGVLSCYDRMILQGTLPRWCYEQGMTALLYSPQIKIFDCPSSVMPRLSSNVLQLTIPLYCESAPLR